MWMQVSLQDIVIVLSGSRKFQTEIKVETLHCSKYDLGGINIKYKHLWSDKNLNKNDQLQD